MADVRSHIRENYYPLDFTLDEIRPSYVFDVSCQGSVPQALEAFFEADSFESAIRNAISIGGDSDTIAAIAGSVAEARWGVPDNLRAEALARLDAFQRKTVESFENHFRNGAESQSSHMTRPRKTIHRTKSCQFTERKSDNSPNALTLHL